MFSDGEVSDIDLIKNYPKKAINKLSTPIIISMLLITFNSLIDSIWISGLGPEVLAAIGFVSPLIMIISSLGNGLGIGANSIISRFIGEGTDDKIVNASIHSIILTICFSIVLSLILLPFIKNILMFFGAGEVIDYAISYAWIIFAGIIFEFVSIVLAAIIRSEGAIYKSMGPLIGATIINMIIDPILIYFLNLGIRGAALATVVSSALSIIPLAYWIFIKKDTFAKVDFSKYHRNFAIYKDILTVGIPSSLETICICIVTIFINSLLSSIGGIIAVGGYGVALRILSVLITPIFGIGVANITVVGMAFGEKNKANISKSFNYSTKMTLKIAIVTCSFILIFAPYLAELFAYGESSQNINEYITHILYILGFSVFTVPLRAIVINVLQAMGKGITSMCLTFIKESMFYMFSFIFAFYLGLGPDGIYYGMLTGGMLGSLIEFSYVWYYIRKLSFN